MALTLNDDRRAEMYVNIVVVVADLTLAVVAVHLFASNMLLEGAAVGFVAVIWLIEQFIRYGSTGRSLKADYRYGKGYQTSQEPIRMVPNVDLTSGQ